MPTKIITKNSSVAAAVPTAAVLELGELAVNVTDKRLFTENASGTVVELGTNPSTLNVTGAATFSGEIEANGGIVLGNNDIAQFGSIGEYGDGLQVYHDGFTAWFDNQDSEWKDTQIKVQDGGYITFKAGGDSLISAVGNANVSLFHNGSAKLATTATGIVVNGEGTFSNGVYLGGSAAANHLDDYETGTWIGKLNGLLATATTGKYTKVGNLITVAIYFNNVDTTGASGAWSVTGLPFTVVGYTTGSVWSTRLTNETDSKVSVANTGFTFVSIITGAGASGTWASAGTGTYAMLTIQYMTS